MADIACYGKPYDEQTLENMKRKRLQELRVKSILVELLLYVCFLTILYFISYNNRDFNSFHITRHLNNQLLQSPTKNSSFHTLRYSNVTNPYKSYRIFRFVPIFNEIDAITLFRCLLGTEYRTFLRLVEEHLDSIRFSINMVQWSSAEFFWAAEHKGPG